MSAEMRGGGLRGGKGRALAGTPDQLSLRAGLVCVIACICCACLSEEHWPPRITPPVTDMFSLRRALKSERWRRGVNGGREGLAKAIDGWMWEAIYSTLLCSLYSSISHAFPIFHLPGVTPPLSLTICLPRSHTLLRKRQHIKNLTPFPFLE